MYVIIYSEVYVDTHIYICVCVHIYICTDIYMQIYIVKHTYVHAKKKPSYRHASRPTPLRTYLHTYREPWGSGWKA